MGKLPVGQASLEGVRLIGRRPASLLAWALAYLLAIVGVTWVMASVGASAGAGLAVLLGMLFGMPVVRAAVYRSVLKPEQGPPFLGLWGAEARQLGLVLVGLLFAALANWLARFVMGFIVGIGAGALPWPVLRWAGIAGGWAVILGFLALVARFALAGPMTLSQGRLRLFGAWSLSRGRTRQLLGFQLLVIAVELLVLVLVVVTLFGLLEVVAGMLRWRADQLASVFARPLQASDGPWLLGVGYGLCLLLATDQALAFAPWARAYQVLTGGPAPRPAPPLAARAAAFGPLPLGARVGPGWTAPVILVLAMSLGMGLLTVGMFLVFRLSAWAGWPLTSQALSGWLGDLGMSVAFDLLVVLLLLLWTRWIERRTLVSAGLGGRIGLGDIGWFLGGAMWAFVLSFGLGLAVQAVVVAAADPQQTVNALTLPAESLGQAPAVLIVIILLAFSEEVMFRGWLLSALAPRAGMANAIAISSLLFAAFHVMPWELLDPARLISFLSYAAIGAGFAAVALGRGQLWSSTALHAGYNSFLAFATMAAQHSTPQKLWGAVSEQRRGSTNADEAIMMLGLNLAIAAVLFGLLLLARRRRTPLPAPVAVGV